MSSIDNNAFAKAETDVLIDGWINTELEAICDIKYGKDHKKLKEGVIPCYGSGGIMRYVEKGLYRKPSVLIPRKGTLSNLFYIDEPFWTVDTLFYTQINEEKVIPRYLYYLLKTFNLEDLNVGSAIPSLTTSVLNKVSLNIPNNLSEQKSIVRILKTFDDKIELLKAQNETLETIAQTLFNEWFVINPEEKEVENNWSLKSLNEISFNHSETYKFDDGKVVFINTGDVLKGQFLHNNLSDPKSLPGQAKKAIYKHDILYSEIRPKNKRFAFVDFEQDNYVVSTKFMIIRPKEGFSPFVLYQIFKNQSMIDEFNLTAEARSGTFPQITFDSIKNIKVALPPKDILCDYEAIVRSIMDKKRNNNLQVIELKKMRNTILPKLMNGKIRIKEFQK
ncbi:type I restriction enzyme S subunit [Nonlabens xylanidelens]|uniref:Type I restriction enzyme S subunit n=1 Tax=Nonlabens xylanidelens TaxID=191564 RepID=A0A2S6IEY3_9FLAO|nr:restriction endonuclease subunit S [Nonlabens xylanidelens]PPK92785.1 type I restriction enzyme S subunit [Nonlabens xylanidelens]PQJ19829.1 hypothetical protein BST94_06190 [Nonlabens xylanidelens]